MSPCYGVSRRRPPLDYQVFSGLLCSRSPMTFSTRQGHTPHPPLHHHSPRPRPQRGRSAVVTSVGERQSWLDEEFQADLTRAAVVQGTTAVPSLVWTKTTTRLRSASFSAAQRRQVFAFYCVI